MKKAIYLLIIMFTCLTAYPQIDSSGYWLRAYTDTTANFFEIVSQQEQFFKNHPDTFETEDGMRSEFYRWHYFWRNRLDNSQGLNGNIYNAVKKYYSVINNLDRYYTENSTPSVDWQYLGPKGLRTQNYGVVGSVAIDPTDPKCNTIYAGTGGSGLWKTSDGGLTWKNITGQHLAIGVGVMDIAINPENPDEIFIALGFGGMGRNYLYGKGVMRTTNGGQTWQLWNLPISQEALRPIAKLAMDPNNPDRILAFGRHYIYKTINGGLSWSEIQSERIPESFCRQGNNWISPKLVKDVVFDPENTDNVYVATDKADTTYAEVWKILNVFSENLSVNDFINVRDINGLFGFGRFALDIKNGNNGNNDEIYLAGKKENEKFYLYKVDGVTNVVTAICSSPMTGVITSQFEFEMSELADSTFVACGNYFKCFRYNPNGTVTKFQEYDYNTLENKNDSVYHTDTRALAYKYRDGVEYLFFGNDGGVTKATRKSKHSEYKFANIDGNGLYITQFYDLSVYHGDPVSYAAGAQDNEIICHGYPQNSGWKVFQSNTDGYQIQINPQNRNKVYFIIGGGSSASDIAKTLDGFATISNDSDSLIVLVNDTFSSNEKPLLIKPDNPDVAYVGYQNIYKANDWNSVFTLFFDRATLQSQGLTESTLKSIAIAPSNSNYMYATYAGGNWDNSSSYRSLIRTTNANSSNPTWTFLDQTPPISPYPLPQIEDLSNKLGVTGIAVATDNPSLVWLIFGNFWDPNWGGNKQRVIQYEAGSTTFTDITSGLPNLPVNCIKVFGNTNDGYKIFIGNDLGVYYHNTTDQGWTMLNKHLPPCIVTDIETIDYFPGGEPEALRIATFGYGIWETWLDCNTTGDDEYITESTTWKTDMRKNHNVYIEPGASLTITSKISFTEGTGIIVEPGSQLYVNGGILTSACGSLWNGVSVIGDPDYGWNNMSHQGYAVFTGAIVENAIAGVRTLGSIPQMKPGESFPPEPQANFAGGTIRADSTIFRNNYISVLINPCHQPKMDQFSDCTFEITSELLAPGYNPGPLVKLNDLTGAYFRGCIFRTDSLFSPRKASGIGILSNNATYIVDSLCKAWDHGVCVQCKRSLFRNLDYGIKALAFSPTRTLRVDRADFVRNNTGMYLSAITLAQVTRNHFNIIKTDTLSRDHFGGLYLDYCTGYTVEENVFNGVSNSSSGWSIGTIVNNSNIGSNENADNIIYNNSYNYLDIGILAQNKNRNVAGNKGLTLKCNDFANFWYDIAVTTNNANIAQMGLVDPQGVSGDYPTWPAGNTFSSYFLGKPEAFRYYNQCDGFTYIHHDQNSSIKIVDPSLTSSTYYTSGGPSMITLQKSEGNYYTGKLQCCPPSFSAGGGGGLENVTSNISAFGIKADSIQQLMNLLVDGGSTEDMKNEVDQSTPPEATEIYSELLNQSPYLSDTVLASVVNNENVLTSSMVTDILSENPQSAKSDTVVNELESRVNQLSEEQMNEIMQGLYEMGAKEKLEAVLHGYIAERTENLNSIIRYYIYDTLSNSPLDSVVYYADMVNELWAEYYKTFKLTELEDFEGAEEAMDIVSSTYTLTQSQQSEYNDYEQYLAILKECSDSGVSVLGIDSASADLLNQICLGEKNMAKIYAGNVLRATGNILYQEDYILPVEELKSSYIRWMPGKTRENNDISLYPNPASEYVVVKYSFHELDQNTNLRILDMSGKVIKNIKILNNQGFLVISVSDLLAGCYLLEINLDKRNKKQTKLIIAR